MLETGALSRFDIVACQVSGNRGKLSENVLPNAATFFCSICFSEIIGINDLWQICVIFVPQPRPLETNRD